MKKLLLIVFTLVIFAVGANAQHKMLVLHGDGEQNDTKALNAWGRGEKVLYHGKVLGNKLEHLKFFIDWQVRFNRPHSIVRNNTFFWHYTGYDRTDWVVYGRKVKHRKNKIVDLGME